MKRTSAGRSPFGTGTPVAVLLGEAGAAEQSGKLAAADTLFHRVLAQDPGNMAALVGMGRVALLAGRVHDALAPLNAAARRAPRNGEVHRLLAVGYLRLDRPDRAEPHAVTAAGIEGSTPHTLKLLYECAYRLGRADRARVYAEKARALHPEDPALILDLAEACDASGDRETARILYRKLVEGTHPPAIAYARLAYLEPHTAPPPEAPAIAARLAAPDLAALERWHLHHAQARIADDLRAHEEAFAHYTAAAAVLPRTGNDAATLTALTERIATTFTPAFFAERKDFGSPSRRPVFVFGMPRSGTTLVEQIVASHPKAAGAGELPTFAGEVERVAREGLSRDGVRTMASEYLKLLRAFSERADRVVDKMPHNFERLWLLALAFPNAAFIHCRRDPVATCVSCFTQPLGGQHAYLRDLEDLGRYYRAYHRLMDVWRAALPVTILDVDYEALVTDPDTQSRRLIEHIGLAWDDRCLRFHETRRTVLTPSRGQVARPIYTDALTSWKRFEPWLGPLFEALGDLAPARDSSR